MFIKCHRKQINQQIKIMKRTNSQIVRAFIQGVIEGCTDVLATSCWVRVELGKDI
jgi:hypothetical protein